MYSYDLTEEQFAVLALALQACKGPGGHERHAFIQALDAWGKKVGPIVEHNASLAPRDAKKPLPPIQLERGYLRGLKAGMLAGFSQASQVDVERFYEAAKILGFQGDWEKVAPRLRDADDLVLDVEEPKLDAPAGKPVKTAAPAAPVAADQGVADQGVA